MRQRCGMAALLLALAGCGEGSRTRAAAPPDTLSLAERRAIPGHIAFVSERDGNLEVYLIRPSGEGERRLTARPTADYPAAAAPDGSGLLMVAVAEGLEMHLEELVLQPLPRGDMRRLGPRTGRARNPSWSPDGSWLVFESDLGSFRDLYQVRRDGSGLRRLTDNEEGNFEPAVSPTGDEIAFVSSRDGNAEIYRMRADGSAQVRLTAFHRNDTAPRWSPDGRWIAFLSDREGAERIFLMAPDGTGQRRLRSDLLPPDLQEEAPAWSPDGERIAYAVRETAGTASLWISEIQSGESRRIAADGEAPAWSPDGRFLAFVSDGAGEPQVHLVRADGTAPTRITRATGPNWLPRWIPRHGG